MLNKIKYWIRSNTFKYSDYKAKSNSSVKLFWWNKKNNFGDSINYDLISFISHKKIEWVPYNYNQEYYMATGSIIHLATNKSTIWGSGLISSSACPLQTPKKILAVRGPLTRKKLLDLNIECPHVYGDPALLLPKYYMPKIEKKYDLGIIPHYIDKKNNFFNQKFNDSIKIIDIEQKETLNFIDQVLQCKRIISSTLHGIIIADAYNIPVSRVIFSNKISGGNFKFDDYYLSIKRNITKPYYITTKTKLNDILSIKYENYQNIDLKPLLNSCPFKLNLNKIVKEK